MVHKYTEIAVRCAIRAKRQRAARFRVPLALWTAIMTVRRPFGASCNGDGPATNLLIVYKCHFRMLQPQKRSTATVTAVGRDVVQCLAVASRNLKQNTSRNLRRRFLSFFEEDFRFLYLPPAAIDGEPVLINVASDRKLDLLFACYHNSTHN